MAKTYEEDGYFFDDYDSWTVEEQEAVKYVEEDIRLYHSVREDVAKTMRKVMKKLAKLEGYVELRVGGLFARVRKPEGRLFSLIDGAIADVHYEYLGWSNTGDLVNSSDDLVATWTKEKGWSNV